MRSLRSRLLVSVLAITAAGLILLASILYFEQRRFLLERSDGRLRSNGEELVQLALEIPRAGPNGVLPPNLPPDESDDDAASGDDDDYPKVSRRPRNQIGEQFTYAQLVDSKGQEIVSQTVGVGLGDADVSFPQPTKFKLNKPFTITGSDEDSRRYRAIVRPVTGEMKARILAFHDLSAAQKKQLARASLLVSAVPLADFDDALDRLLWTSALVIAGILAVLGVVAAAVVRIGLLPLDRIGHTAGAIASGDLSRRVAETDRRSEVGRLGLALNRMLDRLEEAFKRRQESEDRLRSFIADASHELRTPLASIRGYAELYRIGAASDPKDTAKAMQRIEDEANRMGVLVEDLLTLAKLDEVRQAPHLQVDLSLLVNDAASDARAAAPDREVTVSATPATMVEGDKDQLHQVLVNLLRNAVVHTPEGSPLEITLVSEQQFAKLTIRDFGPGLPTENPEEIFERFWRAEGGRKRGKSGAGLGLAIVAAIVDAHGGSITARNVSDGQGAIFEVTLPLAL